VNVLDFDDTYIGHPGATIVAVALNVGEYLNSSGKELITAVGLAYELMIRIGLGLRSSKERKYVHEYSSWQVFGAVIVAARKDAQIRSSYYSMKAKKGSNSAKVATAKRLLKIVYQA